MVHTNFDVLCDWMKINIHLRKPDFNVYSLYLFFIDNNSTYCFDKKRQNSFVWVYDIEEITGEIILKMRQML